MPRISLVSKDVLTPAQKEVYDRIVAGPRGTVVGPLRAVLHSPDLADRWQALGEFLRYKSVVDPRFRELAIIVVARFWNSELEWQIHADAAVRANLDPAIVEAIRVQTPPVFADPKEAIVYEYARQILENGRISDAVYDAVHEAFETVGVVELTALIGYYTMVSMTLNAHHISLPASDPRPQLPGLDADLSQSCSTTRLPSAVV